MVTNDIEALSPGKGSRAAMLTVKGKLLADVVVYADEAQLFLELDGSVREKILGVLDRHIVMDDVEVEDVSARIPELGVYGDEARAAIERALGAAIGELPPYHHVTASEVRVARATELGMPGYHVFGALDVGGERLSDEDFEILRVEAGTPLIGVDMEED